LILLCIVLRTDKPTRQRARSTMNSAIETRLKQSEILLGQNESLTSANELRIWRSAHRRIERLQKRAEVERRFREFTHQAASIDWPSANDFLRALHVLWWHLMEDLYCNYDMPADLSACSESCKHDLEIVCLSSDMHLYGCCAHGSLHECAARFVRDPQSQKVIELKPHCACTITTRAADVVCMFSGRVAARHVSNVRSASRDFKSESSSVRGRAGYAYVSEMRGQAAEKFENKDQSLRENHTQEEAQASSNAAEACGKRKRAPKRFVAKSYRECKVRDEVMEERERFMREIVERVVQRVLYDKKLRAEINEWNERKAEERCVNRLYNYHSCNTGDSALPSWIECVAEFWTPLTKFRLLPCVELDAHERTRFGRFVVRLWQICHSSPFAMRASAKERSPVSQRHSFCTLKQFTIAVLYLQKEGLYINAGSRANMRTSFFNNRLQFIPFRPNLIVELPHKRELPLFSDAARAEMQQYLRAESHVSGAGEFLQRGASFRSKKKKKAHRALYRNKRVEVADDKSVSESQMLPDHWQNKFLGDTSVYAVGDINRGVKFLLESLNSYDVDFLHEASSSLDFN